MGLCDYDSSSSSDSDSSTVSVRYFEEDIRYHYPSSHKEGTASTRNRSHTTLSKKKRTWSETDNESDLPGVPDYPQPSGSSARFCYDSDAGSDSDDFMLENKKRRGAGNDGKPVVVPIASSVRDMDLDLGKSPGPLPPPAPRPTTTAVRNVLGRRRPVGVAWRYEYLGFSQPVGN
ncbi:hypothetical protein QBC32DRAFT_254467 [Pseudoneurospora amorphoporcata]|uniref:Uncharacterized protein n=1 Tax=Pseudoneurospora amorphoporcata TaxID=241081 RepID=A0AAN6NZF7_9PEZI|nr:hypothetical protein QBC32DRAFT_254467 [Pseudoneurospora amorphoporcata]